MNIILSDINLIINIVLGILVLILAYMVISMYRKQKRFLVHLDAHNVADSLTRVAGDLEELKSFKDELEKYLEDVERRLKKSLRSVHTVRFNPWKNNGEGGSQSFATTFLNEEGDGVVISTLYSRDHVSVFGKPLKNKTSTHELSGEEQKSIDEAIKLL